MTVDAPPRLRARPFWADFRFLAGIVLILVSVAGVWLVVAAARQTSPVLAAAHALVPGDVIGADDVRVVQVALGSTQAAYVPESALAEGVIATRAIAAGELLPAGALASADSLSVTRVVITSANDVPGSVVTGSRVEVWAAPRTGPGQFDVPRILVPDATVQTVTRDDSMLGSGVASVEVVINRSDVADVLGAIAGEAAISVVPLVAGS